MSSLGVIDVSRLLVTASIHPVRSQPYTDVVVGVVRLSDAFASAAAAATARKRRGDGASPQRERARDPFRRRRRRRGRRPVALSDTDNATTCVDTRSSGRSVARSRAVGWRGAAPASGVAGRLVDRCLSVRPSVRFVVTINASRPAALLAKSMPFRRGRDVRCSPRYTHL